MAHSSKKTARNPVCLCNVLREASRAVSQLYDVELRPIGMRNTQYSLLRVVVRLKEVQQGELRKLMHLDQTTLTRNLQPLVTAGWITIRKGQDQRQKIVLATAEGIDQLARAFPAWERAQNRMRTLLSTDAWSSLMVLLPEVTNGISE